MAYRNYGPANGFVVNKNGQGDFTTIAAALTAATSGTTIYIYPGTYTENLTLKAGVNLAGWGTDGYNFNASSSSSPNVNIIGKLSFSSGGTVVISGIGLQTNSDFCLSVTGSVVSSVILNNCQVIASNNTAIQFTSSQANSLISLTNCQLNIAATGIGLYTHSSAGTLSLNSTTCNNSGGTTTNSSNSSGVVSIDNSIILLPLSSSSTGSINLSHSNINTSAQNTTCITTAGSGTSNLLYTECDSGSASCLSIGTGTIVSCRFLTINSSNTNAITGAGTLIFGSINFTNSSSGINTTTVSSLILGRSGTWTPGIDFGGGTTGITYTTQSGEYTQIGNMILFQCTVTLSNKGSSTGSAHLTGLPVAGGSNFASNAFSINYFSGITLSASNTLMAAQGVNSSTTMSLVQTNIASATAALTNTNFSNTSSFSFSGVYFTA